jgi:hypothetical protein
MLTTDQKGAIAETAIAHAATALDMIFLRGHELVRVQCKWASRIGDVVIIRCYSCRRAREGMRKRLYTPSEIDALAAYSADTGSAATCRWT